MDINYLEGYEKGIEIYSTQFGLNSVDLKHLDEHSEMCKEISDNLIDIMEKKINCTDDSIRGFLYEEYEAGTFNLDAISKNSNYYAKVKGNNDVINDLEIFDSRNGQVVSFYQLKNANVDTIKKSIKNHPGYAQTNGLIINTDVYDKVEEFFQKKIRTSNNMSDKKLYGDLLEGLNMKIEIADDGIFIMGLPISKDDMHKMVDDMREQINQYGRIINLDLKKYIDLKEYYSNQVIFKTSLEAGANAALISFIMQIMPIIIQTLIYEKGYSRRDVVKVISSASGEAFIRGVLSSTLVLLCKSGRLGNKYLDVTPEVISGIVIIAINTMKNTMLVSKGDMSWNRCMDELVKDSFVVFMAYAGKAVGALLFKESPQIGAMIGSFMGSFVGNLAFNICHKTIISLSIDTGFTMFGLVSQDYTLPDEIIDQLGIDYITISTLEYEEIELDFNEYDYIELDFNEFDHIELDVNLLRRGLIAYNTVGYY